jgi:hypothetical protein
MAIDFVEHLTTEPNRCRHAGRPLAVAARLALHATQLALPRLHAAVRRAVAVALATLADERTIAAYSRRTGILDALRGATYVVGQDRVRFVAARVVTDATADGTRQVGPRGTRTTLRLRGPGVPSSQLTLDAGRRTTRISGTVGGNRVAVRLASK